MYNAEREARLTILQCVSGIHVCKVSEMLRKCNYCGPQWGQCHC